MATPGSEIQLRIPFMTLLKVALFILLVLCAIKLWLPFLFFTIAILLAITLYPVLAWLERKGARHGWAMLATTVLVVGTVVLFLGLIIPALVQQVSDLAAKFNQMRGPLAASVPPAFGLVRKFLQNPKAFAAQGTFRDWVGNSLLFGKYALAGLTTLIFLLVSTLYLLHEGKSLYAWLVSFVPQRYRARVAETAEEICAVIMSYMRGQIITSALCGIFTFALLASLRVPGAVLFAVAAAIFDILPVVGTILMTLPPVLVALTISPARAVMALLGFLGYHLLENYFIIPRVYGKQMRLSALTVLLAITVGATLQGVLGMVLILPLVASYPIIERLWLRRVVSEETVRDHERLQNDESGTAADSIANS